MSNITVKWDNPEHTLIVQVYDGELRWDEFDRLIVRQMQAMLDSVRHPVDIIADLRTFAIPPAATTHYARFSNVPGFKHPNVRRIVVVITSEYMRALLYIFRRVYAAAGQKLTAASSMEEARALLCGQDAERDEVA